MLTKRDMFLVDEFFRGRFFIESKLTKAWYALVSYFKVWLLLFQRMVVLTPSLAFLVTLV